jgi:hypothetical protein
MDDPLVLCDANVFYSILLTDLILSLSKGFVKMLISRGYADPKSL